MATEAESLGEERRSFKDTAKELGHKVVSRVKPHPGRLRALGVAGLTALGAVGAAAILDNDSGSQTVEVSTTAPGIDSAAKVNVPPRLPGVDRIIANDKEQQAGYIREVLVSAQEPELAGSITGENLPGYFETTINGLTTRVIDFKGLNQEVLAQEIRAVDELNGTKVSDGTRTGTLTRPVFRTHGRQSGEFSVIQRYLIIPKDNNDDPNPFKVFLGDSKPSVKAVVSGGDNGSVARALTGAYLVHLDGTMDPGSPEGVDAAGELRESVVGYVGDLAGALQNGGSKAEVDAAHPGVKVDISGLPTEPLVR